MRADAPSGSLNHASSLLTFVAHRDHSPRPPCLRGKSHHGRKKSLKSASRDDRNACTLFTGLGSRMLLDNSKLCTCWPCHQRQSAAARTMNSLSNCNGHSRPDPSPVNWPAERTIGDKLNRHFVRSTSRVRRETRSSVVAAWDRMISFRPTESSFGHSRTRSKSNPANELARHC